MTANLKITPASGRFDVDAIRSWLAARPDVFEVPRRKNTFIIVGLPSTVDYLFESMSADSSVPISGCKVTLSADLVMLNHDRGDTESQRSAVEVFEWLLRSYDCRVQVEGFADISEDVRRSGAAAVYSDYVRSQAVAWRSSLINVGRFRELQHGWDAGPSLVRARRDRAGPDDERIAAYLEAGHLYEQAESDTTDYFDRSVALGRPHLLTDGVYVWPADLAYYVRTYHVELPPAFAVHARNNGWHVPANVDVASLPTLPF